MSRPLRLVLSLVSAGATLAALALALAFVPGWVLCFWSLWVPGMWLAWRLSPRRAARAGLAAGGAPLDPSAVAHDRF